MTTFCISINRKERNDLLRHYTIKLVAHIYVNYTALFGIYHKKILNEIIN